MLARTVSLPPAGPHLQRRPVASATVATAAATAAAASRAPKGILFSLMPTAMPGRESILRSPARAARREPRVCAFSTIVSTQAAAMSRLWALAGEDRAAAFAESPPMPSRSSTMSASSSKRGRRFDPKFPLRAHPPVISDTVSVEELPDSLYTERSELLLSKRSLIEGAAKADLERNKAPSSPLSNGPIIPTDAISTMLNRSVPEQSGDQANEKAENSLAHQALKAIRDKSLCGVVVSAGKMDQTVTVRFPRRDWSRKVKRHYCKPSNRLVHDPANAVRVGDVVSITLPPQGAHHYLGERVFHVVDKIVVPFGVPLEERPPVMSMVDLALKWRAKTDARLERRRVRREAAVYGTATLDQPGGKMMKRTKRMRGKTNRELKEEGGMKELLEKERKKKSKWKEFRQLKQADAISTSEKKKILKQLQNNK